MPQIYVGIISNLIVFPVNFTIAFLFKKSRPRRKRPNRIGEALRKMIARQKTEDANAFVRRREAALPSLPQVRISRHSTGCMHGSLGKGE